nr:glutamate-rich protein 1 isoform X3 [Anser cygnoides]
MALEVLKARLDGALGSLVWWEVSLPMAGGLELGGLSGPFQPNPFCGSLSGSKQGACHALCVAAAHFHCFVVTGTCHSPEEVPLSTAELLPGVKIPQRAPPLCTQLLLPVFVLKTMFIRNVLKRLYPETSSSLVHTSSGEEEVVLRNPGSKSREKDLENVQTLSAAASTSSDAPSKSFQGSDDTVLPPRRMYTVNLPPEGYVAVTQDTNSISVSENSEDSADSTDKSECTDSAVNSTITQELLQHLESRNISSSDVTRLHQLKSLVLLQDIDRLKDALKQFQEHSMMPPDHTKTVITLFHYWITDILPVRNRK